jgi:hypothetical protein
MPQGTLPLLKSFFWPLYCQWMSPFLPYRGMVGVVSTREGGVGGVGCVCVWGGGGLCLGLYQVPAAEDGEQGTR